MIVSAVTTLALYCPRCGKIQLHDVSRFALKDTARRKLVCSCGEVQATFVSIGHRQYLLKVPCVVCQSSHVICLEGKRLWRAAVDKIYCESENLELGFVGPRHTIEELIASHQREVENLLREIDDSDYDDSRENPQIMFEILNVVHDIAERGRLYCQCGSYNIQARVIPGGIELQCAQCGGYRIIPAHDEQDVARLKNLQAVKLAPGLCRHHK